MTPSINWSYSGTDQLTDDELSQLKPSDGEQQLGEWNSTLKDKVDNSAAGKGNSVGGQSVQRRIYAPV